MSELLTIEGQLPIGLVIDGVRYRNYVMREVNFADLLVLSDTPDDVHYGLAKIARTTTFVGLERSVTLDEFSGLHEDDGNEIMSARGRLVGKRKAAASEVLT